MKITQRYSVHFHYFPFSLFFFSFTCTQLLPLNVACIDCIANALYFIVHGSYVWQYIFDATYVSICFDCELHEICAKTACTLCVLHGQPKHKISLVTAIEVKVLDYFTSHQFCDSFLFALLFIQSFAASNFL